MRIIGKLLYISSYKFVFRKPDNHGCEEKILSYEMSHTIRGNLPTIHDKNVYRKRK